MDEILGHLPYQGLHYLPLIQQYLDTSTESKMDKFKYYNKNSKSYIGVPTFRVYTMHVKFNNLLSWAELEFYGPVNNVKAMLRQTVNLFILFGSRLSPLSG